MKLDKSQVLLSPEDEDLIENGAFVNKSGYVAVKENGSIKNLHRLIFLRANPNQSGKFCVDHINRNKLDNRRENLRALSYSGNTHNSETRLNAKGVCFDSRNSCRPYYSHVQLNGKKIFLGFFATEQEAHEKYIEAKKEYFQAIGIEIKNSF